MTDHELEQRLRAWYQAEIPADETAPVDLRVRVTSLPRRDVATWRDRGQNRRLTLLAAAAVLTAASVGVALLAGSDGFKPPSVVAPSGDPSALVSPSTLAATRIVYTRERTLNRGEEDCPTTNLSPFCHRASVFVANGDGSGEEELVPGPSAWVVDATADGSTILVLIPDPDGNSVIYRTDLEGSEPELVDTGCRLPCTDDWGFSLSPDGSRIAFARNLGEMDTRLHVGSVIAVMELSTGKVTELDATLTSNPDLGGPCHSNCGEGDNWAPTWSPDGDQLLFPRGGIGIPNDPRMFLDSALFVVDVDGANLRQLTPLAAHATYAQWSPDGALITFVSSIDTLATGTDNWQQLNDIYTIRPDGTGMVRLTADTVEPLGFSDPGEFGARFPNWTLDGHIVFTRNPERGEDPLEVWVMAVDGTDVQEIDPSDASTLSRIGCVSCPYPPVPLMNAHPSEAFWIGVP